MLQRDKPTAGFNNTINFPSCRATGVLVLHLPLTPESHGASWAVTGRKLT